MKKKKKTYNKADFFFPNATHTKAGGKQMVTDENLHFWAPKILTYFQPSVVLQFSQ